MTLVIDLRCLQDRQYYERGIGTHARNLIRHAPAGWVGIYDPALPPLPEAVAGLAARLSPHAYVPGASMFLNPWPFSPGQNFCARLLTDVRVTKAVCVYDFIPFDEPERYLWDKAARLEYLASLAWLKRYDLFFPISVPTDARLRALFGTVESVVTGVGLPPFLDALPEASPHHILMVGGDDARLARLLEDTLARRDEIVAAQAGLADAFSEQQVAAKVFSALQPKPITARRLRLALLSPLPPARSGVADHSAALLTALRELAEVNVFATAPYSALAVQDGKYDAVLCVIGNAPLHKQIYDLCLSHGAAALCHDARLLGLATSDGLADAAQMASEELGRRVTEEEIEVWARDESKREASFLKPLARAALPLIFHSPQPASLCRERFGAQACDLPFPMMREHAPITRQERAAARKKFGIMPEEKLIVSFGFLVPGKGIEEALAAFAILKAEHPNVRLVFAGEAQMDLSTASKDGVTVTGFLGTADYRAWAAAADAGLQLRVGQPGGISAALQDCIGAGLPTVASRDLAENINAPDYVTRLADTPEPGEIAAALEKILAQPRENEDARAAYCAAHSMQTYARRLVEVLTS